MVQWWRRAASDRPKATHSRGDQYRKALWRLLYGTAPATPASCSCKCSCSLPVDAPGPHLTAAAYRRSSYSSTRSGGA